ncbi:MAG: Ig-like domain-containing protein [Paludibacteraceae bacterium]|nr:Ig-like domain-containing protein [Paludibacteraceae bacterium]
MRNILKKSLLIVMACFTAAGIWAADVTFTMANIFDGQGLSFTVTSPTAATVSSNTSKGNAASGKLGSDGHYFEIILTTETFTAASINGYINTNNTAKNWAFQFSTDRGASWGSELTQANDGNKSAHDIAVGVTIPAGANGFRVVRRAGTSTQVNSITLTLPGGTTPTTVSVTGVSLDHSTLSLEAGQTGTLTATVAPSNATNQNVSWTSSNTAVATVANGVVTAVSAGSATITVTTEDGSKTATCTVTVTEPASQIPVTAISLNKSTTSIEVGKTETLSVTYTPANANTGKAITWMSSDPSVATVDQNGQVTGIAIGTATIIASAASGASTSCEVTVTASTTPPDPPVVVPTTNLTIHVPEIYEAKAIAGGYGTPLTVVDGYEYEVFYINRDNNSNLTIATSNSDKAGSICDDTQGSSSSCVTRDGWAKITCSGTGGDANATAQAEFQTSLRCIKMSSASHALEMHIQGYDQISFYGKDNNGDATKNKKFEVYIDDVKQTRTPMSAYGIERYTLTAGEHVIRISAIGGSDSKLCSFSLRIAQEPRAKWVKGNDSTQVVLQTTAPKPVYYFTKYNSKGQTRLVWEGQEATGITLNTYAQSDLGDTLVLSGTANCPVGTYTYHVISYYNGQPTSNISGKLKVSSEIAPQTETQIEAYQNEAIDDIKFKYYALSADDVTLTWANGNAPAGITGSGANGTYLISGTPTQTGTFIYTISVAGGNSITDTIVINVLDLGNDPILYLYKNNLANNRDGIYKYLISNEGGKRNLIARKAKADGLRPADQYAKYKWVLISEDVDADNPEILAIARGEAGLPVLSMKSFSYTPERLDWGEPDNGSLTQEGRYITVWRGDHPIFKALNKKQGDRIQVLDTVVGKGLMPMSVNYTGTICLATALTRNIDDYYADGYAETVLHEVPAEMHRNQKYLCLPIGMEGSNYLTRDGKKLLDEAIKYILSNQATVQLPTLAITDFRVGSYVGKINEAEGLITLDVLVQDSDAMKTAMPKITLASPLTFASPDKMAEDGSVDFSNWYYGVRYIVSDYINKRGYQVVVRLYDPLGIENTYMPGEWINIYDMQGRKLTTTNEDIRQMDLPAGVYIIATQNGTFKITK